MEIMEIQFYLGYSYSVSSNFSNFDEFDFKINPGGIWNANITFIEINLFIFEQANIFLQNTLSEDWIWVSK